jgi:hypothetical protein
MDDCERIGRLVGGCNFEARYDTSEASPPNMESVKTSVSGMRQFLDASRKHTYVRDVCTRCGKTIERQTKCSS